MVKTDQQKLTDPQNKPLQIVKFNNLSAIS